MENVAFLIIDMQNDIIRKDGALKEMGLWKYNDKHDTIKHIKDALEICRKKGVTIIHIRVAYRPGFPGEPGAGFWAGMKQLKACEDGTFGGEIIPELSPKDGELVVTKTRSNSFYGTDLESLLINRGIKNVIITGEVADFCVASTVFGFLDRCYGITVISDGVVAPDEETLDLCARKMWPLLGCNVIKVSELEKTLAK
jgi:nicotinamidase-related amidase